MEFLEDRLYSQSGFWVKIDGDIATIGISPLFLHRWGLVGQIVYDEESDDQILVIQCGSSGFQPFAKPLAGTPIPGQCNNEVLNDGRINDDPCNDNNWIYKMKTVKSSAAELITASQCRSLMKQ